jgi:hypothetical protein
MRTVPQSILAVRAGDEVTVQGDVILSRRRPVTTSRVYRT